MTTKKTVKGWLLKIAIAGINKRGRQRAKMYLQKKFALEKAKSMGSEVIPATLSWSVPSPIKRGAKAKKK